MSIYGHAGTFRLFYEIPHLSKVHRTVMPHHRSLLHGVSSRHLIEIRHGNLILFSLSQEFIDRHAGSELEIRRKLAVHIILKVVIRIKIVV